jgi:hypothetical protein
MTQTDEKPIADIDKCRRTWLSGKVDAKAMN